MNTLFSFVLLKNFHYQIFKPLVLKIWSYRYWSVCLHATNFEIKLENCICSVWHSISQMHFVVLFIKCLLGWQMVKILITFQKLSIKSLEQIPYFIGGFELLVGP